MAGKLVARHLAALADGWHNDGRGLYLRVRGDSRNWAFRYRDRVTGKLREMGLGGYPALSLSEARVKAEELRGTLSKGTDPLRARREAEAAARVDAARDRTFGDCAVSYIAAHAAGWRNAKHAAQWRSTLDTYAAKLLPLPVKTINTDLVMDVLEPIWRTKTETASRVRQRIEAVMGWAEARKYHPGPNPARWRNHLDKLLASPNKLKKVKNRAALPYAEMPAFWAELSASNTLAALALRLQILTACRPGEACGAHWDEFNMKARIWTIPGERMKAGRDHRVPLSDELEAMLKAMPGKHAGLLFPGAGRAKAGITTEAVMKMLKTLRPAITAHGFRSTFRDWAAEHGYPRELAEPALAHANKDKVEAVYLRSDVLERRRKMMQHWARYLHADTATVTPIRAAS